MLKQQISSPLEAGPSILDAAQLPPRLTPALEYASSRLAKKGVHLSIVVMQRDYQGCMQPSVEGGTSGFAAALKSLISRKGHSTPSSAASTPPLTPASSVAEEVPLTPGGYRYVHGVISSSAARLQHAVLRRASRKFGLGSLLSPAVSAETCGLTPQLVHNSFAQRNVLFSSDGLTLLSLDRLYCVKSALASYCMTESPLRLEDAVDELRRCVLSNRKIVSEELLRSYETLSVNEEAIEELDIMYRRAYGGSEQVGAISGVPEPGDSFGFFDEPPDIRPSMIGLAVTTAERSKPSTPRVPVLKLQTKFDPPSQSVWEDDDEDECTARPADSALPGGFAPWNVSFENLLSATSIHGPMTPNGYDDISPITRGEWGFLIGGNGLQGRIAAVETC